ncbi:MAG: phage/plasmid primase, P4 family [Ginsengibacter sp.]
MVEAKAMRMMFSLTEKHQPHLKIVKKCITAIPHETVLQELLSQLKTINFREASEIEGEEKLQKKHYIVYSMVEILKTAQTNGWQLCRNNGQTFIYNGAFWKAIDRELLQSFFGEAAELLGIPKADARFYQFRLDLLKQFDAVAYLPAPERKDGLTLINFLNGTFVVDAANQSLRNSLAEDFITYQLPFDYNPSATAPMFTTFLNRVLPDIEKQDVLQEYLGYVFVSSNKLKLEKVLLLYGTGANGKSVFIEIMSAMLGKDNVSRYSLESITDPKSYSRAELSTKLLNLSTEISGKMDKGLFKQLASGESVEARHIYGAPFTMDNYAKLLFSTNELPKETESTDGFFRRWLIIAFEETIPENEQDKELAGKIIANELSGVLNWVLVGLNRLLIQKKFSKSESVKEQVKNFRQQSDSVLIFLEEAGYQPDLNQTKALKELFVWYRSFCEENGYRSCSSSTFSGRLKNAGYEVKRLSLGNVVYCKK